MGKKSSSKSNYIMQGSILAIASIVSRIIGLLYRLPVTNIITDHGNDYYSAAYEIYNVILLISSYSLPLAVSKVVSARWHLANTGIPGELSREPCIWLWWSAQPVRL